MPGRVLLSHDVLQSRVCGKPPATKNRSSGQEKRMCGRKGFPRLVLVETIKDTLRRLVAFNPSPYHVLQELGGIGY